MTIGYVIFFTTCFFLSCSASPVIEDSRFNLREQTIGQSRVSQAWDFTLESKDSACACQGETCSCCTHFSVKIIHWQAQACVEATLIPESTSLEIALTFNGQVLFQKTVSAHHPPKICVRKYGANVCVALTDVQFASESFEGCVDLSASAFGYVITDIKIGCFKIPNTKDKLSPPQTEGSDKILYLN